AERRRTILHRPAQTSPRSTGNRHIRWSMAGDVPERSSACGIEPHARREREGEPQRACGHDRARDGLPETPSSHPESSSNVGRPCVYRERAATVYSPRMLEGSDDFALIELYARRGPAWLLHKLAEFARDQERDADADGLEQLSSRAARISAREEP